MRVYFVRHADRIHDVDDLKTPLSPAGVEHAIKLAVTLSGLQHPDLFLTSGAEHALETANILAKYLGYGQIRKILTVTALTPHTPESQFNWRAILAETGTSVDWSVIKVVACVGHEPRLGKLIAQLTSKKIDPLRHAETVWVEGDDMQQFLEGKASVGPRLLPFSTETEEDAEKALQPKIQSKMQVSTFLAGFTFAALVGILTQDGYWQNSLPLINRFAAATALVSLAWSSALFAAAIYMFDRLAMPRTFWFIGRSKQRTLGRIFDKDCKERGLVYAHMVWTWKYVFSVAVLLALLGFAALVFHRGVPLLTVILLLGLAGIILYYWKTRPELGID